MSNIIAIALKDLKMYFSSVIGYVVVGVFAILSGYFFSMMIAQFSLVSIQIAQQPELGTGFNLTDAILPPLFGNAAMILLFMIPMLTMRSLSEEKKEGTIELLYTYPVTDIQIVLGKFIALLGFVAFMLVPLLLQPLILVFIGGAFALKTFFVCVCGLYLLGIAFSALGLFISSLTENQIISVTLTFASLLLFWLIGWAAGMVPKDIAPIFTHLAIMDHFSSFAQGIIDSQDVLFYVLFIVFFLFCTLRSLESRKWRGVQ